jgi:drug/metabolite transporter (DMT)-like permease
MLEKGFLKPTGKEETSRAVKRSRMFFVVGIFMVLAGFLALIVRMQQGQVEISIVWLILLITGFLLISISMWMNFFAQNMKRRN